MPNPVSKPLELLCRLIRRNLLLSTTAAGSGHLTSSLSAVEIMVSLLFGGFFRYNASDPDFHNNDRLIFSKGHAAPLLYTLWAAAGEIPSEELLSLRKFGSRLEGHPTFRFPFTDIPTGSLGQGLAVGLGMALNAQYLDKLPYKTYVLLGDGEMVEGSNWESLEIAAYYRLHNLIGIIDISRLEQDGETPYQKRQDDHGAHDLQKKIEAFGWQTIIADGHSLENMADAYHFAQTSRHKPTMILAVTVKGKGISFLAGKNHWHGKTLNQEQLQEALEEIGKVDIRQKGRLKLPQDIPPKNTAMSDFKNNFVYPNAKLYSTRKAYGEALTQLAKKFPHIVALDAGMSNSTYSEIFHKSHPEKFFEMFIAEQNMVGVANGLAKRGKIPFISTFASFFTRAFDQIRMAGYAETNIKYVGSHSGVSVGEDGVSQMGLEDIAMFRTIHNSVILYPSDAISAMKLVETAAAYSGPTYLRMTRRETPLIYSHDEEFSVGGSKTLFQSQNDQITLLAAGITLHEAMTAYQQLKKNGVNLRIIDLYSIKPLDTKTLQVASQETSAFLVVEDHFPEGGIAEAVRSALKNQSTPIYSLAVKKLPRSGTSQQNLEYQDLDSKAIIKKVKEILYTGN